MYLAPVDENRVRYLMNKVPLSESNGDANTAKNIAVSSAVEQFVPCWLSREIGTVYLGNPCDYSEFDYTRYDARKDPLYTKGNAPNFRCALILRDLNRIVLFCSSDAYDGTVEELILLAVRIQAYRMKLRDKNRPNSLFVRFNG
jgi:hypothetical protein